MQQPPSLLDAESLARETRRGEETGEKLRLLAEEAREKIILSYTGAGGVAAWIAYWVLKQTAPGVPVEIQPGDALALHVLAYRESRDEYSPASDTTVYLFAGPGGENQAIMVRDAAVYTGARLVVISPPLPPLIQDRLGEDVRVEVLEGVYTIVAPLAAARLAAELALRRGYRGVRVRRVAEEAASISKVLPELLERFQEVTRRASECRGYSCAAVYTPTMVSAAVLHSLLYGSRPLGIQDALTLTAYNTLGDNVLLLYTRGDVDLIREVRFRAMSRGANIVEMEVPTDPLTAPLYAILVLHARSVD